MNGYFDHNATTPLCPAAREAFLDASTRLWHNPSGLYREAAAARRALEDAREELADLLSTAPTRIVFNSGATEGCNAVFRHFAHKRIAISSIEHPCVTDSALGAITIPCSSSGITDLSAIPNQIDLLSIMAANNEHGVLQPWRDSLTFCQENHIQFHCDASQWIGKLPLDGLADCHYLTATAHKFGGPKGCGFLIIPESATNFTTSLGGPQENSHRAGTEDYPAIAAMLAALKASQPGNPSPRDAFEAAIIQQIPGTKIVGAGAERLWNTSMIILPQHLNLKWLTRLSARSISVSTGSACSAGKDHPSRVLLAMGYDYADMSRVLRFSSGHHTTTTDWLAAATALTEIHHQLSSGHSRTLGKISLSDL